MRGLTKVIEWSDENVPSITDEKVLTQMLNKYPNLDREMCFQLLVAADSGILEEYSQSLKAEKNVEEE